MKIPILSRLFEKRTGWSASDERWWHEIGFAESSATGVKVTETSALQSVAVFACVRLLSETLASIPLPLYKRLTKRSKQRASEHPLYSILHDSPNPEMTSFNFREVLMGHLVLWGNAYAEIDWKPNGKVNALWPLRPDRMRVARRKGKLWYHYRLPDGTEAILPSYQVLHIPGLGFDGIIGYSPIHMAREAIGLSLATEEFGAKFFGNGANPGGVLEHPQSLSKEAQDNLRESWNQMHQGLSNQHRIAILEEGMKYQQIGIPPDDAQFIETRKFQRGEIASFFHIPPHMIGDLEKATYSNIEHQAIEFVIYTMRPWFVRWEQAINKKLLWPDERKDYFAEFLVEGLLRGDVETRYKAYATARQWGWLSADDIRELENMDPLPDGQGQIYYMPMNMLPAGEVKTEQKGIREERNIRSGTNRQRVAASYRKVFEDSAQRIVEREANNIRRAVRKHLSERSMDSWQTWLDDFYRDFPEYIGKQIAPAVHSLAEAIQPIAADEVNGLPELTPEIQKFIKEYIDTFDSRYVKSSKGQIEALVREAVEENKEPVEVVETRMDEWEQTRAGKVAMNETVQLSNAVAKFVFAGAGVTRLRWQTSGSKSCPLCQELNGKIVGIEQPFVSKDSVLEAEGASPFKAYRPTSHPPLHQGCSCVIVPE